MEGQQIGRMVREARERRGLSLAELGRRSGVDRAGIWRIEQGKLASRPSPETLSKLAAALDISPKNLYLAAGYAATTRLPTLRPYLRAKYGHLPPDKLDEMARYFERIEAEYGHKKPRDKH